MGAIYISGLINAGEVTMSWKKIIRKKIDTATRSAELWIMNEEDVYRKLPRWISTRNLYLLVRKWKKERSIHGEYIRNNYRSELHGFPKLFPRT